MKISTDITTLEVNDIAPLTRCSPVVSQLFAQGNHLDILNNDHIGMRVGMVGTRSATPSGLADTRHLARVLAHHGFVVVSGMAAGIDGAAHQGAIEGGGKTIAVLGCGVDVVYPARHTHLAKEIKENGCLVSEYDCGTGPLAWHFPIRNRIIAAMSDVLVVTEGTLRGGARITVDLALAMGKPICALPGPRRSLASELPNMLIRDGAVALCDPADVLATLGLHVANLGWVQSSPVNDFQRKMLDVLSHEPASASELAARLGSNISNISRQLADLENAGQITYKRGAYWAI